MGKCLRGASDSETGNAAPVFGNYTGNKENTSIGQKKHWKSQEVASYSPAYFIFSLFFFFMHQAMFIDRYDYHSDLFTFSCIFMLLYWKLDCSNTKLQYCVEGLHMCRCHLSTIHHSCPAKSDTSVSSEQQSGSSTEMFAYKQHDMNIIRLNLHHIDIS